MADLAALGLACAIVTCTAWGVADYLAAHITRRIGEARTLLRIQAVGVPVLLVAWMILRPPLPNAAAMGWITLAAASFFVGYLAFFYGLRVGAISLVSPISSAGALIPVAAGIVVFGEAPSAHRLVGIALTLTGLAITLTDFGAVRDLGALGRRRGVWAGSLTLVMWGSGTALLLPVVKVAGSFAPIAILRVEVLFLILGWWLWDLVVRSRTASGPPLAAPGAESREGSLWPAIAPAALLDLIAFFAYGFALQTAPASVAAPIASAYPLVTILIARHRLGERLSPREWSGVGATLAGVAALGFG
jgi:drug/metabolite transporter (DMT)-like permease